MESRICLKMELVSREPFTLIITFIDWFLSKNIWSTVTTATEVELKPHGCQGPGQDL